MLLVSQKEYPLQGWSLDKLNHCFLWRIEHTRQNLGQFSLDQYIYISISMSLSEDTGIKQSFCPNCLGRKYIISRILDTVAFLDVLIQWLFQDSFTLSRSVWRRSAQQTQTASMQMPVRSKMLDSWGSKSIHQLDHCLQKCDHWPTPRASHFIWKCHTFLHAQNFLRGMT